MHFYPDAHLDMVSELGSFIPVYIYPDKPAKDRYIDKQVGRQIDRQVDQLDRFTKTPQEQILYQ